MLSHKADDFIDAVLACVNYSFARKKIRIELESHLTDKIKSYMSSGKPEEEAEALAIRDMGDIKEIGEALNKTHKPVWGWMIKNLKVFAAITVLIIFSIAVFNIGANHARSQKVKQDTSTYIGSMYWEINSTTNLLRYVENWNDSINTSDLSVNPFNQLLFSLDTMKNLSQTAMSYIGYTEDNESIKNITDSFDLIFQGIGGGITYNNQLICYDFLKDGILSEKEIRFLITLREELKTIQASLINSLDNENRFDMPLEEFARITNPFVNKYNISNLTGIGLSN